MDAQAETAKNQKKPYPKKEKGKSKEEKPKSRSSNREPAKKLYKVVIRKLPARNFTSEDFSNSLDRVCFEMKVNRASFSIEHFVEGKISRKRGPVFGVGFVSVSEESDFRTFLLNCPTKNPFIEDDMNGQPEISAAPNQRVIRFKEKVDKLAGTYETDQEFTKFLENMDKPLEKPTSSDLKSDKKDGKDQEKDLFANNPLLNYLREKAARKLLEKRKSRDKKKSSDSKSLITGVLKKNKSKGERNPENNKTRSKRNTDRDKRRQEGRKGPNDQNPNESGRPFNKDQFRGKPRNEDNKEGGPPREDNRGPRGGKNRPNRNNNRNPNQGEGAPAVKILLKPKGDTPAGEKRLS